MNLSSNPGTSSPTTTLDGTRDRRSARTAVLRQPKPQLTPRSRERILLAEDDPILRKVTRLLLEELGYAVVAYANGDEALRTAAQTEQPVELVFADFDMPGITGYELARRLRSRWPGIRVLLASGAPEQSILPEPRPEDWPRFIAKPYSVQALADAVREVLDS